jgi:hypothetical protein
VFKNEIKDTNSDWFTKQVNVIFAENQLVFLFTVDANSAVCDRAKVSSTHNPPSGKSAVSSDGGHFW